jgi:hypothetical protein
MFTLLETMKNRRLNSHPLARSLVILRIALLVLLAWLSHPAAYAEPQVSGRVLDEMQKPLSGVQLKLLGDEKLEKCSFVTKINGEFALAHEKCKTCCLAVYPPKGSGLAAAWIDDIPGNATRNIIIQLHPGFTVKGRVVRQSNGKGLKGLTLLISPVAENGSEHEQVHGSGLATTSRDGRFEIILTPGVKQLSITNESYPDLVSHFEKRLVITAEANVPDIALPAKE